MHRRTPARYLALGLLVAAVGLLVGTPSGAQSRPYYGPYRVTLEDASGNPLRTFTKDGTTFVLGYFGERFAVRIENPSDVRVEAVLSIDGRDAVSGRPGDYVRQRGYLIPAYGSVVVDGFRTNLDSVAAFRFSRPSDSYSARMGTPENVGVVGVAFFPENRPSYRPRPAPYEQRRSWERDFDRPRDDATADAAEGRSAPKKPRSSAPPPAPTAAPKAAAPSEGSSSRSPGRSRAEAEAPSRLGTEYGESRYSPVTEVPFRRANATQPSSVVRLRYDDAGGLRARGIDVYPRPSWDYSEDFWPSTGPEAFPVNRFAPPPP